MDVILGSVTPLLPEFVRLEGIVNQVTGDLVPIEAEIHRDDLDWLVQLHQDSFMLDWELSRAELAPHEGALA